MLYHEIYGSYYRTVAAILEKALEGPVSRADMARLCNEHSFGDSALNIPDALLKGDWALLTEERRSVLERAPAAPLTLLERRWLKAVSLDPRVKLFDVDFGFLGDVEPLFRPEDILCFDCYGDGDDYEDPAYQATFRLLLQAIGEENTVRMTYASRRQKTRTDVVTPLRLEYSGKDDRFRVICATEHGPAIRNLAGIVACEMGEKHTGPLPDPDKRETRRVELEILNYRNTLERMSLHFAHLRKEVERAGENRYRMILWYDTQDEPEMYIRVLQFGPMVKVVSPASFAAEIRKRVLAQAELLKDSK
ncbi:MAG: WYL domain-containing protein [Clostridia bacterium]|nr:WYL domain-containing protein [Clostridia bacterium]